MKYYVYIVSGDDAWEIGKTDDKDEAIKMARDRWAMMCDQDRKTTSIEVREPEAENYEDEDCTNFSYWLHEWREEESK